MQMSAYYSTLQYYVTVTGSRLIGIY